MNESVESKYLDCQAEFGDMGVSLNDFIARVNQNIRTSGLISKKLVYPDIYLAIGISNRNESAWSRFARDFEPFMRNVARKYLRDFHAAEDVVGDCLERIPGEIGKYRGVGSLYGYVSTIVYRKAIDRVRSDARKPPADGLSLTEHGPDTVAQESDCTELIKNVVPLALNKLKDSLKLPLQLMYFENMRNKEIANVLGLHPANATRRIKKAREAFDKMIRRVAEETPGATLRDLQECL